MRLLRVRALNCLNEYHLQFLRLLLQRNVRFLIIGGQARSVHQGTHTRDLDIWVDISKDNRPALHQSLVAWKTRYPAHSMADFSRPGDLRPNVQIKFPDTDAMFLGAEGQLAEIGPAHGVDVLTSVGLSAFKEFYDRADWQEVAGLRLPFVACGDTELISPQKSDR
jgi:hypothetical protein